MDIPATGLGTCSLLSRKKNTGLGVPSFSKSLLKGWEVARNSAKSTALGFARSSALCPAPPPNNGLSILATFPGCGISQASLAERLVVPLRAHLPACRPSRKPPAQAHSPVSEGAASEAETFIPARLVPPRSFDPKRGEESLLGPPAPQLLRSRLPV